MIWNCAIFILICSLLANVIVIAELNEIKCIVCRKIVHQIHEAIINEDQNKKVQIGSFRIQPDGTQKQVQIKYAGSEIHLNEILETICNSMEDYAQAKHKETGEVELLNLSKDVEQLSIYDLVPDPDLNRSLKYYCETFIEYNEEEIISFFRANENLDASVKLCSDITGYCSAYHSEL